MPTAALSTASAASSGVVLMTSGTGLFGFTMVRRLLAAGAFEIRVLIRDELKQDDVIGARHGERFYEILAAREGLVRATDQGEYYRVPPDSRDLNHGTYLDEDNVRHSVTNDYNSHTAERLDVDQVVALRQALPACQAPTSERPESR